MSEREIDEYLATLDEPKRGTLGRLRNTILEILPEAEQGISYGMPAFRLNGKVVAGFAGYVTSKGALQFSVDKPLPKALVKKLIAIRRRQLGALQTGA